MKKRFKKYDQSLTATILVIFVIVVIFIGGYIRISHLIERRCILRMEEGSKTAIGEVQGKLMRDSRLLNSAASLLTVVDDYDKTALTEMVTTISPLMETGRMHILLPDNSVITPAGETYNGSGDLFFEEEAPLGEHVTGRRKSISGSGSEVIRHFVPIVQNGETAALLYSVTELSQMPSTMNIDNIYNASASVYIIDRSTGDFILDTWHNSLGNINDFALRPIKGKQTWDEVRESILSGETGYAQFKSASTGDWLYMYYAPSEINNWEIAISVPAKSALENKYAVTRILWVIAALMALVITVYYFWVLKNSKRVTEKAVEQAVLEARLQKAEAAERAKTMFLSNMSHDIRTPMNAIIGFTTLARTNIDNKERVKEYLSKILSSGEHLLTLINDVLDMSRIESGKFNLEEKECRISDIFKDMRNIIQTQMQTKQINFFMDTVDVVDEDIYCDKLHLNQVLLNLLSNAIKFTPSGGSVSLTIKQKPIAPKGYGAYEITVKDTGIGMAPEFLKHIFEPFERERTSTVSGIQGTGLGMPISKNIVEAMGGTIEVKSEQGKGTEFIINIEFRLVSEPKEIEIISELKGLRALVVDDNFATCDSVSKMLVQIGLRAEWTLHGHEAVLRTRQAVEMGDEFYVYIVDWALPDLSGIEVVRQIRAAVGDSTPIIVLTAYDWSTFEDEAKAAGVTAFCSKPLFLSDLRHTLAETVVKQAANGEVEEEKIVPDTDDSVKGKRFLLVEDNELNREIAEEILTEAGFVVESAVNGAEAVKIVSSSKPGYYDLILMDVQMPIMDGYEASKAIRALADPTLANIPIIAMTANAFEEDKKMALECGMNAHIAKPININLLIEEVERWLKKS